MAMQTLIKRIIIKGTEVASAKNIIFYLLFIIFYIYSNKLVAK